MINNSVVCSRKRLKMNDREQAPLSNASCSTTHNQRQPHLSNEQTNDSQFKLHIDSNLIKSNESKLPDELKHLGVSAYDEREFEKGVMLQVDLQLSEYELNKCKQKMKQLTGGRQESDEEHQQPSSDNDKQARGSAEANSTSTKRKNDSKAYSIEESYKEKKSRLESTLKNFKDYLSNGDRAEASNELPEGNDTAATSSSELLIKAGEMTPFGTTIDFDSGKSKRHAAAPTSLSLRKITNDFDAFLLNFDKRDTKKQQAANSKKPKYSKARENRSIIIQ
jgi:hypothetical protein